MRFETGIYEKDGNGHYSFRNYDVNEFIRQLSTLCSSDYESFKQEVDSLCKQSGTSFNDFMQFKFKYKSKIFDDVVDQFGKEITGNGWSYMDSEGLDPNNTELALIRQMIGYKKDNTEGKGINAPVAIDQHDGLPKFRHTNFYTNGKPMFSWFINDEEIGEKYVPSLKKGHIYIQFFYYVRNKNIWEDQYVDTNMMVTGRRIENNKGKQHVVYEGFLDVPMHLPYVLDHWCVLHYRKLCKDEKMIYLMSPEQALCTGIIDKLRQIMAMKRGKANAQLLKQAIEQALLKDKQALISDANKQMQTISRIKVIPLNMDYDSKNKKPTFHNGGHEGKHAFKGSHWFNWFDKKYKGKSYSDVFSNENAFDIELYRYTLNKLNINITFLSEKNMNDGLFCVDNTDFKKFLLDNDNVSGIVSKYVTRDSDRSSNVDSVFFMMNGEDFLNQTMVCTIVDIDEDNIERLDYINKMKKVMQRIKLVVCQKYPQVAVGNKSIVRKGDELNTLEFDRFKTYLSTSIEKTFKGGYINEETPVQGLDSWALVGFLEQEDKSVTDIDFETYQNMSPAELQVFHQKLDGISCDAWATYDFCKNLNIVAKRTYTINCSRDELSQNMLNIMRQIDRHESGEDVGVKKIDIINNKYKTGQTLSHYSVECNECGSRMVDGDPDYVQGSTVIDEITGEIIYQGRLSPWSKAFFCPVCNNHIVNEKIGHVNGPYEAFAQELEQSAIHNSNALVKANFIGEKKNGYKSIIIEGYKEHEDGVDLHVHYIYDMFHPRVTGSTSLLKAVLATRNDEFIGNVKQFQITDPNTGEVMLFNNVQLDMLLPGGAVKGKDIAVMNGGIALNNAVFGTSDISKAFTINKYIECEEPDFSLTELNSKVIRNIKKVPVVRRVWRPFIDANGNAAGRWEEITQSMYVGLISVSATEVSQEFNNTYSFAEPRKFSLNNCDHMQQLGFNALYESVYDENLKSFGGGLTKDATLKEINSELLNILGCLMHPVPNGNLADPNNRNIMKYITDLKGQNVDKLKLIDFQQDINNIVSIANWVPYGEYQDMVRTHPLFVKEKFKAGSYGIFVFTDKHKVRDKDGKLKDKEVEMKYHLRFPSSKLMNHLVNISADGYRARFDDIYIHFLSLFQQLSTSIEVGSESGDNILKTNGQYSMPVRTSVINKLKQKIIDYFMTKKGQFAINSALNLPAIGSKQIGSPLVPWDVVVIPNKRTYRKVVSEVLDKTYEDMNLDVDYNYRIRRQGVDGYTQETLDKCIYFREVYGFVHRDPVLWRQQNYWARVWSLEKANHEFKKMYGVTYEELFPGSEAIMLNSVRMVIDQESDIDGDWVCVGIPPQYPHIVKEIQEYINESNDNGFFQPVEYYESLKNEYVANGIEEHTDKFKRLDKYKVLSTICAKVRFEYLKDEMGDLFRVYPDELYYDLTGSKVKVAIQRDALLESAESKKDIGFLTTSMRYFTYVMNYLKDLGLRNPDKYMGITDELEIMTTFVFQYMLVQREAVRAVKADGSYGKLTLDSIIRDTEVRIPTNGEPDYRNARELFLEMLINFDKEYGTCFAWQHELPLDERRELKKNKVFDCYELVIHICDNFMITPQSTQDEGGGYYRYNPPSGGEVILLDRGYPGVEATHISKDFKDLKGMLHMVIGNSYSQFVNCFSEVSLFNGIYSGILNKVPLLKKVGKDIASLINYKK